MSSAAQGRRKLLKGSAEAEMQGEVLMKWKTRYTGSGEAKASRGRK